MVAGWLTWPPAGKMPSRSTEHAQDNHSAIPVKQTSASAKTVRLALSLPAHPPRSFEVAETAGGEDPQPATCLMCFVVCAAKASKSGSRRKSSEPKHLSGLPPLAWHFWTPSHPKGLQSETFCQEWLHGQFLGMSRWASPILSQRCRPEDGTVYGRLMYLELCCCTREVGNFLTQVKGHVVDHQRSTWPSSGQWLPWWVPSQPPPLLGTVCWLILFGLGRFPGP